MPLTLMWFPSIRRYLTASKTDRLSQLTDRQWNMIKDLFAWEPPTRRGGRPKAPPRACLEGILWVLHSGARWKDLPERFPSPTTCWRRHKEWTESGLFEELWRRLLKELDRRGRLHWEEAIGDGTFAPSKKGARS